MASNTQRISSAQQSTEQGIISLTLTRVMQLLIFLIMTLLFSIAIEWLGMATDYWQEPGIQHSEKMLTQELNYLNKDFKRSAIVDKPAEFAKNFADHFYHITFKVTGIQSAVIWLATPTPATQHKTAIFRKKCHDYYLLAENYILAAMVVTQVFAVRLAVLTLAIPAFVLLAMLGLIDGSGTARYTPMEWWPGKLICISLGKKSALPQFDITVDDLFGYARECAS